MNIADRYEVLVREVEAAQAQLAGNLLEVGPEATARLVVHAFDRSRELGIEQVPRSLYGKFVAHAANLVVGSSVEALPDAEAVQSLRRRPVPDELLPIYERLTRRLDEIMHEVNAGLSDDPQGRLALWEHGYEARKALDPEGNRGRNVALHEAASLLIGGLPDA